MMTNDQFPKQRKARPVERVVFSGSVRQQTAPFYEVKAKGTTVEWTDKRSEAHSTFQMSSAPKQMYRIDVTGTRAIKVLIEAS